MPALVGYDCHGTLTIGSVSMTNPAWMVRELWGLWIATDVRGEDRLIPGAIGVVPYKRRLAPRRFDLPMTIIGDVDENGDPYPDALVGLETNLDTLWTNVVEPTGTGDGTRAATLVLPSGATRTANIHVLGLEPTAAYLSNGLASAMEATLQISIPAGRFS